MRVGLEPASLRSTAQNQGLPPAEYIALIPIPHPLLGSGQKGEGPALGEGGL